MAHDLTLYGNTSLPDALRSSPSDVRDFFESKSFKDHQDAENGKIAMMKEVLNRIGLLAKARR